MCCICLTYVCSKCVLLVFIPVSLCLRCGSLWSTLQKSRAGEDVYIKSATTGWCWPESKEVWAPLHEVNTNGLWFLVFSSVYKPPRGNSMKSFCVSESRRAMPDKTFSGHLRLETSSWKLVCEVSNEAVRPLCARCASALKAWCWRQRPPRLRRSNSQHLNQINEKQKEEVNTLLSQSGAASIKNWRHETHEMDPREWMWTVSASVTCTWRTEPVNVHVEICKSDCLRVSAHAAARNRATICRRSERTIQDVFHHRHFVTYFMVCSVAEASTVYF